MQHFVEGLFDQATTAGRWLTTAAVVALAVLAELLIARVVVRRQKEPYARYYARKFVRYGTVAAALIWLTLYWRPFAGQVVAILGFAAAGLTFALQEVIGALAGWFNILSGRIFRVGDRIQMGGVRGDVIDITPLRTKIMEMGSDIENDTWVRGRQYTGRIVTVSNKTTFTQPVFNYSAVFEYIWEELTVPVSHRGNWQEAERILREEIERASASAEAQRAMRVMAARYPVARADVEPRVFVRTTENWNELSARFVVPVRAARRVKDEVTRRVLERMQAAGIEVASQTFDLTVRTVEDSRSGSRDRHSSE
jgi:small-conductance mechanosensitive channel